MQFIDESKKIHSEKERRSYWGGAFDENNPDTIRHFSMLEYALPLIETYKPSTVLSIGDNRGRDAFFFKLKGGCRVVASDLKTSYLDRAVEEGYLDEVADVDVENIPFADNSFDFVVAKEAFHHWPRPMLGFYECLRVSKFGVILIEPNDVKLKVDYSPSYPDEAEWRDHYENVGNYKYQISLREIIKATWALYLPAVVARGFNDPYKAGGDLGEYFEQRNRLDMMGIENQRQFNLMFVSVLKIWNSKLQDSIDKSYKVYLRPPNPNED